MVVSFISNLYTADKLDERNFLKVNEFLQVDGYTDVFAVGDCNNADQVKMATKAMNQMEVLAQNIKALVDNGEMIPYKEGRLRNRK